MKKTDGYLLYKAIICHRVSTRPQDTEKGEKREKRRRPPEKSLTLFTKCLC